MCDIYYLCIYFENIHVAYLPQTNITGNNLVDLILKDAKTETKKKAQDNGKMGLKSWTW